jgi:alpha-L-fucosidase
MKKQLKELCTKYDAIGVLWFDGEWESTWNDKRGTDLYNYVRNLQPPIIINNRVGAAREGMEGTTAKDRFGGDFGTPEQQIPATGLPGVDWETCMTMNDNWGYNKADKNFKTTKDLLQKLADIASKGGNFLLNVGPTAEGTFPQESIDRLREIGVWMKQNGESVYGTKASPFESLDWGRCTQKTVDGNTRLYLHVFERPTDGQLRLPGIANEPIRAFTLTDATKAPLRVVRQEDALLVSLPAQLPDPVNSVFVLDLKGAPDVHFPPKPANKYDLFLDEMLVSFGGLNDGDELYYTLDGSKPTLSSTPYYGPFKISKSSVVAARRFRNGKPVSGISFSKFTKTDAQPGVNVTATSNGLSFSYYEGVWDSLPEFSQLAPLKTGKVVNIDLSAKNNKGEFYAFVFKGFLKIPEDGVYALSTSSDDGSDLWLNGKRVVDNNRLQGMTLRSGLVALKAGLHEIEARYFQKTGGDGLELYWESEKFSRQMIPASALFQ